MENGNVEVGLHLNSFFERSSSDPHISPVHIAVYMAILNVLMKRGCTNSIMLYSWEVMPKAKISSRITYHKVIRELVDYGYLNYSASYNKYKGSKFELM